MPKIWYQKYGWEVSTNRRAFPLIPHITEEKRAKEIIRLIHKYKRKVFLALNSTQYVKEQYKLLTNIVDLFETLNIDGYIASDLALILSLRKRGIKREIHLSTVSGCYNKETISFYEQFNIHHFCLPRKVSIEEIINLLESTSQNSKFKILLIGEWCRYNEESCFTSHGYYRENFCSAPWQKLLISKKEKESQGELPAYPVASCGICIIPELKAWRSRLIFKLPVRNTGAWGMDNISLVKKIIKILNYKDITTNQCREIMGSYCRRPDACAYSL